MTKSVAGCRVVEHKAVRERDEVCFVGVRSHMKATGLRHALGFNFGSLPVTIKRVGPEQTARFNPTLTDLRSCISEFCQISPP